MREVGYKPSRVDMVDMVGTELEKDLDYAPPRPPPQADGPRGPSPSVAERRPDAAASTRHTSAPPSPTTVSAPLPDPSDFPAMARFCEAQAAHALDGYVPPPQPGGFPEPGTPLRERLDRHLGMVKRGLLGVRQADPYDWEMEKLFCRICRGEAGRPEGGP